MTAIARLFGGLGNQMFQYAAGRALAERLSVPLALELAGSKLALQPFGLDSPVTTGAPRNRLLNSALKRLPPITTLVEAGFHYDARFERLDRPVSLDGYFQSWRYFIGAEPVIRKAFVFPQQASDRTNQLADTILRAAIPVSIHIRRGDYLSDKAASYHGILDAGYYAQATGIAQALLGEDAEFFVFSDDFNWAREFFGAARRHYVVDGTDVAAWEDMYLMSLCKHRIIANSSFSWWGAWLGSEDGLVVAPRQWFGEATMRRLNTCDLIPPSWMTI